MGRWITVAVATAALVVVASATAHVVVGRTVFRAADLPVGATRALSVSCPKGYFALSAGTSRAGEGINQPPEAGAAIGRRRAGVQKNAARIPTDDIDKPRIGPEQLVRLGGDIEAMKLLRLEGGTVATRRQKSDPDIAAAVGCHHWSADRQPAVQRDTVRLHPRRLGRLDNRAGKGAARKPGDRGGRIRTVLPGAGVDETALVVRLRVWRSSFAHDEDREPAAGGVDCLRLGRRRNGS